MAKEAQELTEEQIQAKAAKEADKLAAKLAANFAAKLAAKKAKASEREAAKAAKLAAKEAARLETSVQERNIRNGVKEPKPLTSAGRIWALANALSTHFQRPVSVSEMIVCAEAHNSGKEKINLPGWEDFTVNLNNVKIEYSMWRKFYGITGYVVDPTKEAAKAEKEAAKLAAKEAAKAAKLAAKETK